MSLSFVTLSDENINRVLEDPPLVWQVIAPEEPGLYEAARAEQSKSGVLSKLFRRAAPAERSPDLEMSSAEGIATDIDKAWHGIHYLLTGTEEEGEYPRSFLLAGGRLVGDVDVGYGPARVLSSKETREARDFLNTLADAELRRRFNPADMLARKIYPEIWDRDPAADDTLGYLIEHVRTLRGFLNQTVDNGCGIVVYLS
jgi:uncharacterized protein DUF1877